MPSKEEIVDNIHEYRKNKRAGLIQRSEEALTWLGNIGMTCESCAEPLCPDTLVCPECETLRQGNS